MQIVDANIVLRYILGDHENLSERARQIIEGGTVWVPIEVLCEVVYVLSSVYKITRTEISATLNLLFTQTQCELPHRTAVLRGIALFAEKNMDLVDCILAGYYEMESAEVYTFDQRLQRLISDSPKTL